MVSIDIARYFDIPYFDITIYFNKGDVHIVESMISMGSYR